MKAIIIYKSKYGATKQYADWLSEDTGFPAISVDKFNPSKLVEFDTVIIGSSVYVGKLLINHWLDKNWRLLKGKHLHLFVISGTPPDQKEKLMGYLRSSVPKEILNEFSVTFLHGKLLMNELSWLDRVLVKFARKATEKEDYSEKIMTDYNDVRRENLEPLIAQFKQTEFV